MTRVRSVTAESEDILLGNYHHVISPSNTSSYTQLEAVVNHLYNNVFVYFNEGTKKDVLQIVWSTLPSHIYVRYYNRNDRWSRDCILEAFRENENSLSDAIEEAINNLINCKNIPYVSDAVILFLNKRRESFLFSRINEICPCLPSSTSIDGTRTAIVNSKEHFERRKERKCGENIDVPRDKLEKRGFFLGYWYTAFVAILVILVMFSVTFYLLHKISSKLNPIPEQGSLIYETHHSEKTTNITGDWSKNLSDFERGQTKYHTISTVMVRNYSEYKNIVLNLAAGQEINLTLSIETPYHWADDNIWTTTDNVVDLGIVGAVKTGTILRILSSTPKIRSLFVRNSFDYVCQSDMEGKSYNDKIISLPDLTFLHIEDLAECAVFYEQLVKHTDIKNLHTFRLSRSVVTENNLQHIQNFVRKSKDKIESLEFPETAWNAPIFDYHIGALHKLLYLHIDFIHKYSENKFSINKYIDIFFPNLISFTSSYGYLPITKFQNLSDCKNLRYLKVRVLIPESQTEIKLNTMKSFFPQLQNATIYFKFDSWDSKNECSIEGIHDVMTQIRNFKIRSNCPMVNS